MNLYTCYHCGKGITGKMKYFQRPLLHIRLGVDFPKADHPACWNKAENEAKRELNKVTP